MLGSFISSGQLVHIYCSEVKPECKTSHVSYSGGILIRVKLSCRLRRALSSWCLAQDSTSLCYTGKKKKKRWRFFCKSIKESSYRLFWGRPQNPRNFRDTWRKRDGEDAPRHHQQGEMLLMHHKPWKTPQGPKSSL